MVDFKKKSSAKQTGESGLVRFGGAPKPRSDGSARIFLALEKDKPIDIKILVSADQIPSVDQCALWNVFNPSPIWVYIGEDDPGNELGVRPQYRAFVPVSIKDEKGAWIPKLWSIPLGVHRQISEMSDMLGNLKGQLLRVKRTGSGLTSAYTIVSLGKRLKIEEPIPTQEQIIEYLGPYTREEIIKRILETTKLATWNDVKLKVTGSSGSTASATPSKGKKPAAKVKVIDVPIEEEEEDDETNANALLDEADDEIEEIDEDETEDSEYDEEEEEDDIV